MRTIDDPRTTDWLFSAGIPVGACALLLGLIAVAGTLPLDRLTSRLEAPLSVPLVDDAILLSSGPAESPRFFRTATVSATQLTPEPPSSVRDPAPDSTIAEFEALDPVGAGHDVAR